jgi:LuxR family maltose regulon positive regulatory protein
LALEQDLDYLLEGWLRLLPEELIDRTPLLLIIRMWVLKDHEAFHILPEILGRLKQLQSEIDSELQAQIHFFEGIVEFWSGDIAASSKSFKKTLDGLPLDEYIGVMGETGVYYTTAMQMLGRGDGAAASIEKRLQEKNLPHYYVQKLMGALLFKHMLACNLYKVIQVAERTAALEKDTKPNPFIGAWVDYISGSVYFRQNRLEEAEQALAQTLKRRYIMDLVSPVDCFATQLLVLQARGDTDAFQETLQQFHEFVRGRDNPYFHVWFHSIQARLAILRNDIKSAEKHFSRVDIPAGEHNFLIWVEDPRITYCRLLIARNTPSSLAEADKLLLRYRRTAEKLHLQLLKVEIYILSAVLAGRQNREKRAVGYLEKAVVLAESGGVKRLFIDVADDISPLIKKICRSEAADSFAHVLADELDSLKKQEKQDARAERVLNVCEKLTNREMDVITLLAQRLTNQEIANELSISVATVKRHTITIYQKLQAKNRRDAVIIAVREGILAC